MAGVALFLRNEKPTILWRSAEQIFGADSYFTKTSLGRWSCFCKLEIWQCTVEKSWTNISQRLLFLWTWDLAPSYKRVKRHWNNGIRPSSSYRVGYVKKAKVYIKFISGWDKWISLLPHRFPFGDELGCFDQFLMVKVPILTLKSKTKQTNTF